jgi:eukaryotic-like serine/threonine-protein kinase
LPTPDRARVEALFEAALDVSDDARESFVAQACGSDLEMRRVVLGLLAAHARTNGVLEADATSLMSEPPLPERLGAYRVLRELGRGGMGVVYDAERDDGQFRRRVAIKIMAGTGAELQQRVLAERQILAALDHPHIARLLDGGVEEDGRPYLVMEYVEGLPVDVYCDRMRLTVAERLRLFVTIARAVDAAHRSLVVHRDLKPSNVLVTPDGTVKLLDFGVAKLLNPWLTGGASPLTRDRAALTPEYSSPEQIRGDALTTTTDVYSLGVMLYELLTGRRPHAQHETDPAALMQAVCSGDIERPSARVASSEVLPARGGVTRTIEPALIASARNTTPQRLVRQLRGDCDAILACALRVEPQRRYGSAELLAQDIEHHLSGRPVRAHQGSRGYALWKLVRRHRAQAAALALGAVALVTGAGTAAWQATTAHAEHARAEAALAQSEQVTEFLMYLFESGQPVANVGGTLTARDLVRRGAVRINDLEGQPRLQSRMLGLLGRIHESFGEYDEAQRLTQRALSVHEMTGDGEDAELGELLLQNGILLRRRGEFGPAQESFFRAREILERTVPPGHPVYARTLEQLGSIAIYRGNLPEAERRAEEALELHRNALGEHHRVTVNALRFAGAVKRRRGDFAESERMLRRAIELRPTALGSTRAEGLQDRMQLGETLLTVGRDDEAEAIFRDVQRDLSPDAPEDFNFSVWTRGSRAALAERRGDLATAERLRREGLDLQLAVLGPSHPSIGLSKSLLAAVLIQRGGLEEAEPLLLDMLAISRQTYGERSPHYAGAIAELGHLRVAQDRLLEADSLYEAALQLQRGYETNMLFVERLRFRADVQTRLGRFEEAERLLNEALQTARAQVSDESPMIREIHHAFVRLYTAWRREADAERHNRQLG